MKRSTININVGTDGTPYISINNEEGDNSAKGYAIRQFINAIKGNGIVHYCFNSPSTPTLAIIANQNSEFHDAMKQIKELEEEMDYLKNYKLTAEEEDLFSNVCVIAPTMPDKTD